MIALLAILSNNERLEMSHMDEYVAFLITWYNGKGNFGMPILVSLLRIIERQFVVDDITDFLYPL